MPENQLSHLIALGVVLSRLADIGSTYLLTPNLVLEANEVIRRYRWPFAILSSLVLVAFPYIDPGLGVIILVASFLVSASNIRQAWIAQALGEEEYFAFMRMAAARSNRRAILGSVLGSAALIALTGICLLIFYPSPSWGWYFALGILTYAGALAVHGFTFTKRLLANKATK